MDSERIPCSLLQGRSISETSMIKNQVRYLQNLFYDILNDYGRVFITVKHSEHTKIGNRGFSDDEKEKGLVLVFNSKNHKTLQWTADGSIITALGFGAGNKPENCFIHFDDIVSVFSPEAAIKLDRWDVIDMEDSSKKQGTTKEGESPAGKIISLNNFRKAKT